MTSNSETLQNKIIVIPAKGGENWFFSWRDILNEISFFPESIRCRFLSWSFSPLLQNRKTTCSRIFNTHWFWIGALAGWLAAGASIRVFPFFSFFRTSWWWSFDFFSTKELRTSLHALESFLVSLERCFF